MATAIGRMTDSVVFVGGAVVDLLITDPASPPVRPTKDVDVIVGVTSLQDDFLDSLSGHLGFEGDSHERVRIFLERVRTITSMEVKDC